MNILRTASLGANFTGSYKKGVYIMFRLAISSVCRFARKFSLHFFKVQNGKIFILVCIKILISKFFLKPILV